MTALLILAGFAAVAAVVATATVASGAKDSYFLGAEAALSWRVTGLDEWPAGEAELNNEAVMDVLDEFDRVYPAAVASLAQVEVPGGDRS